MPQFDSVRVTVVSAVVGLALIGALALLLRRRRRRTATLYHNIYLQSSAGKGAVGSGKVELGDGDRLRKKNSRLTSSNGGILQTLSLPLSLQFTQFICTSVVQQIGDRYNTVGIDVARIDEIMND